MTVMSNIMPRALYHICCSLLTSCINDMLFDFTVALGVIYTYACGWQWHQLGHMQVCTSP